MSTNAAVAVDTTTNAPEIVSETMTPAERAYFSSRGEKTDGLNGAAVAPVTTPYPAETTQGATDVSGDIGDVPEVTIGEDGVARDSRTGQFVPKSAYLRVKAQNQDTSQRLAQVTEHLIRAKERFAVMAELGQQDDKPAPAAEPPADIDPLEDIFGAYNALKQELSSLKQKFETSTEETRAQFEARQLQEAAVRDMSAFAQKQPAFLDAYQYLVGQRHKELEAMGVEPGRRDGIVAKEARELITEALKGKVSGAERIYKLAQARGFAAKAAGTNGALDPKASAEIERINKGQAAAASLRGAGGASSVSEAITAQKLANMSDGDYSQARREYVAKHGTSAWNKLLGMG